MTINDQNDSIKKVIKRKIEGKGKGEVKGEIKILMDQGEWQGISLSNKKTHSLNLRFQKLYFFKNPNEKDLIKNQ